MNNEINRIIQEFDNSGGCIQFEIFTFEGRTDEYDRHFQVALQTLKSIKAKSQFIPITIEEELLKNSGQRIEAKEFFGPLFDLESKRVLVKGKDHLNDYFLHDKQESTSEIIDEKSRPNYESYSGDYTTLGFVGAFLDPPYSLRIGRTIFDHGNYF